MQLGIKRIRASIQVVFLILITTLVADAVKSDDISRIESFKRLSQVKTGMSMATVEHIMGPLVKNILEEPGRDREWRFGSDPESRLGTLGTIVFDSNGNVRRISGVACEPMLLGLPPEDQLRRHLCGIDSLDGNDGNRFDGRIRGL